MKRVTASDARRNWFRLLDEVARGEVVVIERNGKRVVLRRETSDESAGDQPFPSYKGLIAAPDADAAETWGWRWSEDDLLPVPEPGE